MNPHPGAYVVKRSRPYDQMSIYFQGMIFFPVCISQTTPVPDNAAALRVARVDISLYNLLKACYVGSSHFGPKTWGGSKVGPDQWWYWSYVRMFPQAYQWLGQGAESMTSVQAVNMFGGYHLFRHLRTEISVMAWENTGFGASPVASLLVQDQFWNMEADRYPSFMELTANGAPWAFPPTQKSVSKTSFNRHVITGTNDPEGEPWKRLKEKSSTESTQIGWNFGTLFLAQSCDVLDKNQAGTYLGKQVSQGIWKSFAVARIRSAWRLGNLSRHQRMQLTWPGTVQTLQHDWEMLDPRQALYDM